MKHIIAIVVAAIAAVGVAYYLLVVLMVLRNFANGWEGLKFLFFGLWIST